MKRVSIVHSSPKLFEEVNKLNALAGGLLELNIQHYDQISEELFSQTDYLVIHIDMVKDLNQFKALVDEKQIDKTILLMERVADDKSRLATVLGLQTHYVNASGASLLEKLVGDYRAILQESKTEHAAALERKRQVAFAVYSPVGGSGKSTIASNLAAVWAKRGKKVLLVDYAQVGVLSAMFHQSRHGKGLSRLIDELEATDRKPSHDEIISVYQNSIHTVIHEEYSFDVLFSASIYKMERLDELFVRRFHDAVLSHGYDVILYDTSAELCERNVSLMDTVDQILLVSTPHLTSAWSLLETKEILKTIGSFSKCQLIVNRFQKQSGFSPEELEIELQCPLLHVVREQKTLQFWGNERIPVSVEGHKKLEQPFIELADKLLPNAMRQKKGRLFGKGRSGA